DSTCTSVAGAVVGFCGNSTTDTAYGETCDDGGTENNDGCSSTCKIEVCGDAITQTNEECDDGNTNNTDGCTDTCLSGSIGTQASPKILWGTPITGLQTTSQIAGGTGVYESYYQVSIDGEGAVILLENALVDVDLYVYSDAAFSTLECSDTSANLNKACKEFAATPGIHTVYIKIVSPTSVSTTFHMTIRGQDVVTANDVAKAISFPQTLPTTGKIKAGTGSVTSSYLISGLTPGNHYNVRLEGETGEVRLEMKLTDIYCQKNWVDYFNPVSCDFQAQASGEMYAYVRSYIGDSISYKLIVTESTPVDLTVNIDNIVSDHISATIFYTITNNGTADVYPDKDVYMWLDAASAPGYADGASSAAFETVVEMIPAGSSMSRVYTVNAKDLNLNSGTAYVLVDMNNTVYETDDANNTSASFAWDNGLSWPPTATPLVLDAPFVSGNIDTEGGIAWYSFDKLKMNGYQLYLDELDTTGTSQTGDVQVTAVLSSLSGVSAYQIGKIGLSNTNDAATVLTWFSSTTTDSTNGTVYLAVKGDTYNDTGSFLIKMLNHIKFPPDASTALTVNPAFFSWINVPDYGYVWASFDVTSGTDYTVLWDDCSTGSACTQLNWQEAVLNLFYPDTTAISGTLWGGGSTGYSFTANQNSTVYIRLQSNAGKTGLVGVKVTSP
ncbi:MAG: DUF4215 domain-containing protein, partial [Spirochaetia bacterium]|nr:DUF4215 domain-containing protein [Spirochaetia bacterium]